MSKLLWAFFLISICIAVPVIAFAQKNIIDSLLLDVNNSRHDTTTVKSLNALIEALRLEGKSGDIMPYGEKMLSICEQNLQKKNDSVSNFIYLKYEAKALNTIGSFLNYKKSYTDGINYHLKAINIQEKIGQKQDICESFIRIANTYKFTKQYQEAIENYLKVAKIASEIGQGISIALAYKSVADTYFLLNDPDQTYHYYNLWLNQSLEIKDNVLTGMAYIQLGNYNKKLNNYSAAIENYLKSQHFFEKENGLHSNANVLNLIADSYHNIGNVYLQTAQYVKALKYLLQALKIRENTNNKYGIGLEKSLIASSYFYQENYEHALQMNIDALEILKQFNNKYHVAECYLSIGRTMIYLKKYAEARENILKSLALYSEQNDIGNMSRCYIELGVLKINQKQYVEAKNYIVQSLALIKQTKDRSTLATAKTNLGVIHLALNDSLENARRYFTEAISIYKEIGDKKNIESCYNFLSEIQKNQGNFEAAYENFKISRQYKDSILNRAENEKLSELRFQYEFAKKEDSLKYQQAITDERLQRQLILAQQQSQLLLLKENQLSLEKKQKEIQSLAFLQARSQLQLEQSKRSESEKELQLASREKDLQQNKLNLQTIEIQLKNKSLQQQRLQRNIFIAGSIVFLLLAFLIFRNYQNQKKANRFMQANAEKQMVELQLENLRAQLNPHFMFNSLNAIQELIVTDKTDLSQSYLERFAKLLRMLLENASQPFITLRKEINFLELYLSLENLRIPDLKHSIEIDPEINLETTITPNMMLQPYVENALWHGLQHKQGEKKLHLSIIRENGSLNYQIRDNGVGRKKAEELKGLYRKEHRSKGMELLSKRFSLLSKEYGKEIITLVDDITENGKSVGTVVNIRVPNSLTALTHQVS